MRSYFPALIALFLASPVAFAADRITFQGLDGSSTRQDVLKRFPNAESRSLCRAGQSVRSPIYGDSCFYLSVENYIVGNRDYNLAFFFHAVDGKLMEADLNRSFGDYKLLPDSPHLTKDELQEQYLTLYKTLNYKYGDPLEESRTLFDECSSGRHDNDLEYGECAEWQGATNPTYQEGQNHIVLTLVAHPESGTGPFSCADPKCSDGYSGDIRISYKFVDMKSADKL